MCRSTSCTPGQRRPGAVRRVGEPPGRVDEGADAEPISLTGRPAGTYYVRVYGYIGADNPSYSLSVSPDRPGEGAALAFQVSVHGTLKARDAPGVGHSSSSSRDQESDEAGVSTL